MSNFTKAALLALCVFMWLPGQAMGRVACLLTKDADEFFLNDFQMVPTSRGTTFAGTIMEIYSNKDGSEWVAIVHTRDGQSCWVSEGENWRVLPPNAEEGPAA